MLMPFAAKKYWNSGKTVYGNVNEIQSHTPLADAIMFGDIEMVKAIIPCTGIKSNPKNRYGSYLHVAVKFGRFEIFKIICKALKKKKIDWKNLKDRNSRTAYEMLMNENFIVKVCPAFDQTTGNLAIAHKSVDEKFKQDMEEYIKTIM